MTDQGPDSAPGSIVNLYAGDWLELLPGIRGRSGVTGVPPGLDVQGAMGVDLIEMDPNTSFPLHTHPGAHVLFILEGEGTVTIGGVAHPTRPGDCYFVPGQTPHAVSALQRHRFIAVGFPHRQLLDPGRMEAADPETPEPRRT